MEGNTKQKKKNKKQKKKQKYCSLQIQSLMQFSAVYFKMNLMFTF